MLGPGMPTTDSDPWGAHASVYDRLFAPLTGYIGRSMLAIAEARIPTDAHVLDVACGSGAFLIPVVERAQRRRHAGGRDMVTGCDYSPGMVELARRRLAGLSVEPDEFECQVQDGQALGYDDRSYDAVFSCFGIFLFEDRHAGWREAARVLRPGGVFATTSWSAPEQNEMFRAQFTPVMEALPARLTEGMTPPGWMVVAEPDALRSEVAATGFEDVDVRNFRTGFAIPDAETAWGAMVDNPAAGAVLRQCDERELETVKSRVIDSLQDRAGGPGRPIVLEASCNILVARRA
ncbi:MAG: methyltransferase domain-containing protein [Myxococcales bacterium FL481]|nr:MAG: methyltransferase domain-containing protein [Myxococcales bacterium FL481]